MGKPGAGLRRCGARAGSSPPVGRAAAEGSIQPRSLPLGLRLTVDEWWMRM
jgi:hypothetical protein